MGPPEMGGELGINATSLLPVHNATHCNTWSASIPSQIVEQLSQRETLDRRLLSGANSPHWVLNCYTLAGIILIQGYIVNYNKIGKTNNTDQVIRNQYKSYS